LKIFFWELYLTNWNEKLYSHKLITGIYYCFEVNAYFSSN